MHDSSKYVRNKNINVLFVAHRDRQAECEITIEKDLKYSLRLRAATRLFKDWGILKQKLKISLPSPNV